MSYTSPSKRFHTFTLSKSSLPLIVSCLPACLPLIFSASPALSACCKITRIIFPALFLNRGGAIPISFLLPYLVLKRPTPTIPLICICLKILAARLYQKSGSLIGLALLVPDFTKTTHSGDSKSPDSFSISANLALYKLALCSLISTLTEVILDTQKDAL